MLPTVSFIFSITPGSDGVDTVGEGLAPGLALVLGAGEISGLAEAAGVGEVLAVGVGVTVPAGPGVG
ncbi:MAG: hypothetical protein WCO52_05165, partial [bacterium]